MKKRPSDNSSSSWIALAVCLVACWGVAQLPEHLQRQVRETILDSCRPIQDAKSAITQFWESRLEFEERQLATLQTQYRQDQRAWETELRRRELLIAELRSRRTFIQQPEASPFPVASADSLTEYDLVAAGVLSDEELGFLHRHILIRSDELTDLERDALVIQSATDSESSDEPQSSQLILDQGTTGGLNAGQPVFAGRCVVGTLTDVGRWISRVRLVTDAGYRGRARILRQVEDSFAYGPEGILEGTGESLCRLRYISRTESVRVGDRVYTNGSLPMYYGQIVRAELDESSPEWEVWIQPAAGLDELRSVQVVRQGINPVRQLVN